jgi:chloramphenicol-sensitive protein RarD
MSWVLFTILAVVIWVIVDILDKFIVSHKIKDPVLATVISSISTFPLLCLVSVLFGNIFLPLNIIFISILIGVFYNIAIYFYYFAMGEDEVSRLTPIFSISPIFVLFFAFIFLGERFSSLTYLGIVLLIFGAVLISVKKLKSNFKIGMGFLIAIFSAFFFALRNIFTKFATIQADIWSILFWVGIGGVIVSLFLFSLNHQHIHRKIKHGIKHLLLVGVLTAVAFFMFTIAVSMGPVSLVSTLIETQSFFVFLFAIILSKFYPKILKEEITKPIIVQKLIAIILIFMGVILII